MTDVKELKLIYSPKNVIFEKILNETMWTLLNETDIHPPRVEGVDSPETVESEMMNRKLLAGVLFHHPAVHKKNRYFQPTIIG